ncbi:MAG TPA: rhodanese-like domain-containing protein [Saprospiraceae bacterium]|nr:rhodanese-like domain-containing protein [Saprospiraceae bacterium]
MTLRDIANHPTVTIIDVREPWEFAAGHVVNSINIPLGTLKNNLLVIDEFTKPILLCCESGNRSGQAANLLVAKGQDRVYNGGGWRDLRNMIF